MTNQTLPVSSKWIVATIAIVIGAALQVVEQLQAEGLEVTGWLAIVVAVLGPLATYLKAENNPSPTAVARANAIETTGRQV